MNEVLDTRYGKLIVNRNDVYLGRMLREYGEFSEGEVEFFRSVITKDMVVIDVGANIGAHTLVFSQLAKSVLAIEAQRSMFHALCGMCALNNLQNVRCLNVAAGDDNKLLPYCDIDTTVKNNLGGFSFTNPEIEDSPQKISCIKIETPCNFMKIDVEGMEREVLTGSADMIRECKPFLYVENDRQDKSDALIEKVEELGYTAYWHIPALFNPRNHKGNPKNLFEGIGSINMICVPYQIEVPVLERARVGDRKGGETHSWREETA